MALRVQIRGKAKADMQTENPILLARELCVETDTGKWKIGDGATLWNSLAYGYGAKGDTGDAGATWLSGSVDPTTEGVDDDYYLNTTTYDVFEKVSGSWGTAIANIKGVQGEQGETGEPGDMLKSISFYIDDDLAVEEKACSVLAPRALTITEIILAVDTAPTGAALIIDVNKNGTTMYTTQGNRPTIAIDGTSATAPDPDVTSMAKGDKISIDIDQIGSAVAGANLAVTIICEVA